MTEADAPANAARRLTAWTIAGIPEVASGADLAVLIGDALDAAPLEDRLRDGDLVVVTSKIVSKAEGRFVQADDREDAITAETVRVVATREFPGGVTRIVENRLGIVGAAAGVDASNTPQGTVLLLPVDPDASARVLRAALQTRFGVRVGVLITDTLGRAWRQGQTDVAIGAAGVRVLDDLRGSSDSFGRRLDVTSPAVADEIAALTDLVKGKSSGLPVAVVRGLAHFVDDGDAPGARTLVRTGPTDMFRLGTDEALAEGRAHGFAEGYARGLEDARRREDPRGLEDARRRGDPRGREDAGAGEGEAAPVPGGVAPAGHP
jgi:coenzyme F420-0:L-glutamate ligase/coenzyme F420-1:gamma-L-glutamate ligase